MLHPAVEEALNLARSGEKGAAYQMLKELLREEAENAEAWMLLAQIVEEHDRQIFCLERVVELRPDDYKAQIYLDHMRRGASLQEAARVVRGALAATSAGPQAQPAAPAKGTARRKVAAPPRGGITAAERRMMRRPVNFPLILGLSLTMIFVAIAVLGSTIAPRDPMETFSLWRLPDGNFVTPPFAPLAIPEFPLGTDFDGRDTLSRLLFAVRPTLVLALSVSLTRLVVGTVLGVLEGWYRNHPIGRAVGVLTQIAITIPLLIVGVLILRFTEYQEGGMLPFIIALNLTGWANITQLIAERVVVTKQEQYVEASRALGGSDLHIMWKHILPQIRTLLPILLSFEMGAALLQLAELGFLGFFLGGGAIRLVPEGASAGFIAVQTAGEPELGQMLSAGWENFFLAPWMAVWAGTAFTLAIFSFMILGEGLKRFYAEGRVIRPFRRLIQAVVGS